MALDSDGERALREQTEHLMRLLHEKDKEIASLHKSLDYARHKINNALITLGED